MQARRTQDQTSADRVGAFLRGIAGSLTLLAGSALANDPVGDADTLLYTGGPIFTADPASPTVEALAVHGARIVYAGSKAGIGALPGNVQTIDLRGATIIPGLIDSHTHPGLVSILGSGDPKLDEETALKYTTKAEFFAALKEAAQRNPGKDLLVLGPWDVASFLPMGPHRRDLDPIFPDRPVILTDNSGHSIWANSLALAMLGIDRNTPDLSEHISVIVRDADGEPTGWLKEFVAMGPMMPGLTPPDPELARRLTTFLDYLSSRGITTLYDAGNLGVEDRVYSVLAELDRSGRLPVRYHGTYHIWAPAQIDHAVAELLRLRERYGGERLKFDTIKIHYDGVTEIATGAMFEDYVGTPGNRGGVLFDAARLTDFLVELDAQRIHLHLHTIGDRATRSALDAVEAAQRKLGRPLAIRVTLAHLELVDPADYGRFAKLGVSANFTPHWFGSGLFGRAGFVNLGATRANRNQKAGTLLRNGANVTLSSDIVSSGEFYDADPLLGLQMAVTRTPVAAPFDPDRPPQPEDDLTVAQALQAYTRAGAVAMGLEQTTGSLTVGKSADFVVLDGNPFDRPVTTLHSLQPVAVYLEGKLASGKALPAGR